MTDYGKITPSQPSDPPGSVRQEGVLLTAYTVAITAWLQHCYELLEDGREDEILSDPFYVPATGPLSDELVDQLVGALDAEYAYEIEKYPTHHKTRSGAETTPDFWRLGPRARRALVEGAMLLCERHPVDPPPAPPPATPAIPPGSAFHMAGGTEYSG